MAESAVIQIWQIVQITGVEHRPKDIEDLREAQFCSLLLQAHAAATATIHSPNCELMPPKLYTLRDTHWCLAP